jgi:hypothetical protein
MKRLAVIAVCLALLGCAAQTPVISGPPATEGTLPPVLSAHPLGYTLPPAAPNLYDNAVFGRFHFVTQRPFQVHGMKLATWLMSAVIDETVRSTGESFPKDILLVHRVGYVVDARNQTYARILALVETLINPATQDRLILFWFDMGWLEKGEANGKWSETKGTLEPVSLGEAKAVMEPVNMLVAIGYSQFAKAHGLPVPKLPVVPVKGEHKRHAAIR